MALSGTLETFSLPDVLRLLSSTKKTGLLALDGDRGAGRIWVDEGAVVAASADRAVRDEIDGVVFELLRFADATFRFEPGAEPHGTVDERCDVDEVLEVAEARLAEWRDIEAVVPSLDVWVRMVPEQDGDVTLAPGQWRILAHVGTGLGGHALAGFLEQGEYEVCREVRDLIELGMVELTEAPAAVHAPAPSDASPVPSDLDDEPTFAEPALSTHEVSSLGENLASFVAAGTPDEPVETIEHDDAPALALVPDVTDEPADEHEEHSGFETTIDELAAIDEADGTDVLDDMAEDDDVAEAMRVDDDGDDVAGGDFLSQLSHLSPKAAAAIEATATPEERIADAPDDLAAEVTAEDGAGAGDEDIDQNLLLRFLSSAKH